MSEGCPFFKGFQRQEACVRRQWRLGRTMLVVSILAGYFLASGTPVAAQSVNAFTVADVAVDVTGATATAARESALAEGENRSFNILLRRLTLRADHDRLPVMERADIAPFIQEFGVANEKTSRVRYLATLTYRFKAAEVRNLLRDLGIQFAETQSKPVLVLPVYRSLGVEALWDDPNPWRQAWRELTSAEGLVPFRHPRGDLTDIATIGAEQAAKGDRGPLSAIAARYKVADALVTVASLRASRRGDPILEIAVNRYGDGQSDQTIVTSLEAQAGESVRDITVRAAREVAAQIEDQWKRDNLLQFDNAAVLAIRMRLEALRDWVKAKRRLGQVAVVRQTDLILLSRDEVRINLHFLGDVEQLSLALAQADLLLSEDESGWNLRLSETAKAGDKRPPRNAGEGAT